MSPQNELTFAALRALNAPRVVHFGHELHSWNEAEWSNAVAGEVGELCNLTKKRLREPGMNERLGKATPSVQDVADECADVVIYLDLLAASMGFDLGAAVARKFNKVSEKLGYVPRLPEATP